MASDQWRRRSYRAVNLSFQELWPACARNELVFVKYRGLNAGGVISESLGEQSSSITARFIGRPAPNNCP
jgi:hypothetical protein